IVAQGTQQFHLLDNIGLRAGRMRIFQHLQLLRELLIVDSKLDGIVAGRGKQGDASGAGSWTPALGSGSNVWGVKMRGAQANLRGGLAPEVPPNAIDAGFGVAGDGTGPGGFRLGWLG